MKNTIKLYNFFFYIITLFLTFQKHVILFFINCNYSLIILYEITFSGFFISSRYVMKYISCFLSNKPVAPLYINESPWCVEYPLYKPCINKYKL